MDHSQGNRDYLTAQEASLVLLGTLLAANPVIIFLLTKSLLATGFLTLGCVLGMQLVAFRRSRRLFAAYVFNTIAVVSIFAHAEAILLHAFPDYVIENLYTIKDGFYFNRPFLREVFTGKEYSVSYHTNAQGFRIGVEQDSAHTVSTVDWLVLGDSYTQGAQVEFEDLYTSRLNVRFPDKIILNAGVSGAGIGHEYNQFVKSGRLLHPSLVILQLCSFNDFMNVEPTSVGLTDRLMTHSAFLRFLLADFKFTNPAKLPLGRWTEPFQPDDRGNTDYNIFYTKTSPAKERDLTAFRRYLSQFKDAVQTTGARLLVVLIPTKEQVYSRYLEEVRREFAIDSSALDMQRPNKFLAEWTRDLGIEMVDLLPAFQSASGNVFLEYDEHMSVLGHTVMADAIGTLLERQVGRSPSHRLSVELAGDRYPMYSVDGAHISYQSICDRNSELFVATPDFRTRRRLTYNDVDECHPMLSRDGSQVLFTQGPNGSTQTDVVIMNLDGSGRTTLTPGVYEFGAIPTFSPSNRRIAYAGWDHDPASKRYSRAQIIDLDVLTGKKTRITGSNREAWRPVFSPDESWLVYIATPPAGEGFDLYAYDLTTGVERQLTNTPFDEWDPQVSPDGRQIVYAARPDGNWDLFILDVSTGRVTRLTRTKGDEWDPSFAPDGSSIVLGGRYGLLEGIFTLRAGR